MDQDIYVKKRDGKLEKVDPVRIKERLEGLMTGLNTEFINLDIVVAKVVQGIYNGVTTELLDNLSAETCAYMNIVHPDYSRLAARITVSNLHKCTTSDFLEVCTVLKNYIDRAGRPSPLINDRLYNVVIANRERIQNALNYSRDFNLDYFVFL